MLIKVSDEIIKSAMDEGDGNHRVALFLLQELAISVRYGRHVVYIPCLEQEEIKSRLKDMMPREYHFLKISISERSKLGSILQKVKIGVNCSFSNIDKSQDGIEWIQINPLMLQKFRWYDETLVIAEHLNDIQFFKSILLYWKKCNNLKGVNTEMTCFMGGGATTAKVVEYLCELSEYFIVVIVDSDKNFPTDDDGSTAKFIRQYLDNHCIDYAKVLCRLYVMQNVRECENLIPLHVISNMKERKADIENIKQIDFSFYDMKCGLNCNVLCSEKSLRYWKNIFEKDDFDFISSCKNRKRGKSRCEQKKEKIIPYCLGTDVLKNLLENQNNNSVFNDIKASDLTDFQKKEWDNIGQILFEWTCGLKPIRS